VQIHRPPRRAHARRRMTQPAAVTGINGKTRVRMAVAAGANAPFVPLVPRRGG
jgi:hypothetical protein